jgi:hypothetical protein
MRKHSIVPLAIFGMTTIVGAADTPKRSSDGGIGAQAAPIGYVRIYRDGNFEGGGGVPDAYYNARRASYGGASFCYDSMPSFIVPVPPGTPGKDIDWNDRVSSIVLYTNHAVTFYEHANYNRDQSGWSATLYPQYNAAKGYWEALFSLQRLRAGFGMKNDSISSFKYEHWAGDCPNPPL